MIMLFDPPQSKKHLYFPFSKMYCSPQKNFCWQATHLAGGKKGKRTEVIQTRAINNFKTKEPLKVPRTGDNLHATFNVNGSCFTAKANFFQVRNFLICNVNKLPTFQVRFKQCDRRFYKILKRGRRKVRKTYGFSPIDCYILAQFSHTGIISHK